MPCRHACRTNLALTPGSPKPALWKQARHPCAMRRDAGPLPGVVYQGVLATTADTGFPVSGEIYLISQAVQPRTVHGMQPDLEINVHSMYRHIKQSRPCRGISKGSMVVSWT